MAYRHIDLSKFSDKKATILNPNNDSHKEIISWFPDIPSSEKSTILKFKITKEGIYSMTRKAEADMFAKLLVKILKEQHHLDSKGLTIMDATANMGGNVFAFSNYFKTVCAVEINKVNLTALKNNIKVLNIKNAKVFFGDAVNLLTSTESKSYPDLIFFDPPWGGTSYDKTKPMELFLSDKSMVEIINGIRERYDNKNKTYQLITMKTPKNYDVVNLKKNVKNHKIWVKTYNKFIVVFLRPI
jgi:16S rRNA G966 N2-methylase RsmD